MSAKQSRPYFGGRGLRSRLRNQGRKAGHRVTPGPSERNMHALFAGAGADLLMELLGTAKATAPKVAGHSSSSCGTEASTSASPVGRLGIIRLPAGKDLNIDSLPAASGRSQGCRSWPAACPDHYSIGNSRPQPMPGWQGTSSLPMQK